MQITRQSKVLYNNIQKSERGVEDAAVGNKKKEAIDYPIPRNEAKAPPARVKVRYVGGKSYGRPTAMTCYIYTRFPFGGGYVAISRPSRKLSYVQVYNYV